MIEPEELYEADRELSKAYFDLDLPLWSELSWPDKDGYQERADELNEARREPQHD